MMVLTKGDCDAAAFYMGMLSHYIADLGCFPHLITMLSHHHTSYEEKVAQRTACTSGLKSGKFLESERYECFQINTNFGISSVETPQELAVNLGYDTRFDSRNKNERGTCDAEWMKKIRSLITWPSSLSEWKAWEKYLDDYKFINRIEKSLQHSVEAVAKALKWVISTHLKYHKELECKCSEESSNTKSKTRQRFLTDYMFLVMWLEIGILGAMFLFATALNPIIRV